jgi:hypothetical protein
VLFFYRRQEERGTMSGLVQGLDDVGELVEYLKNQRPEVRAMGCQVALSLTATEVSP